MVGVKAVWMSKENYDKLMKIRPYFKNSDEMIGWLLNQCQDSINELLKKKPIRHKNIVEYYILKALKDANERGLLLRDIHNFLLVEDIKYSISTTLNYVKELVEKGYVEKDISHRYFITQKGLEEFEKLKNEIERR